MSEQIFELKGNLFTLSVLHLFKNDLDTLLTQLNEKISQVPKFFNGAPIVINLSSVQNEQIDLKQLTEQMIELGLNPVGICNGGERQIELAKQIKLSILTYTQDSKPTPKQSVANTSIVEKEIFVPAQVITGNVRGGQQVYAKNRDLIITGSVSPGAEVITDGNLHIYGTLRGRAIAGASGMPDAMIFCQKLEAELVSINGNYWLSDKLQGDCWSNSAVISLNNESLKITSLVKG